MKKLLLLMLVSVLALTFVSCDTDYDGRVRENRPPTINILETSADNLTDITSSKRTRVQWYGNDPDGIKTTYYYTVTTDTALTPDNVFSALPVDGLNEEGRKIWTSTERSFAYIAFPYSEFNADVVYWDTTYMSEIVDHDTIVADFKAVWSKFFVFGVDEQGAMTEVATQLFRRTNRRPKFPMVFSRKLGLNGFDQYWMTVGPDSAQMVLEQETQFWQPFDFRWMGEDPDGPDVDLEFKWELYDRTKIQTGSTANMPLLAESGWSVNNLSVSFSKLLFDFYESGSSRFRFVVRVRDDAFEESLNPSTINFEVFAPLFNQGILLIEDNDPTLYPSTSANLIMGNPDPAETEEFYRDLLEYTGFRDISTAVTREDSLNSYEIVKFKKELVFVRWDYEFGLEDPDDPSSPEVVVDSTAVYRQSYSPDMRDLIRYNLVISVSDDRSNTNGVDFFGQPPFRGYHQLLRSYLDVGGNVFLMGPSVVYGRYYASPNQMPVNRYDAPHRYVFDGIVGVEDMGQALSGSAERFLRDYFGIYSMTFPESKTHTLVGGNPPNPQLPREHWLADNYDFIGVDLYEHIHSSPLASDALLKPLRVDSARVNKYWVDSDGPGGSIRRHSLKANGTVLTGIPTIEAFKGEIVYSYRSVYDLPRDTSNDSLTVDDVYDGIKHFLYNTNYRTGEIHSPVLKRSGTVATRYVAPGSLYRTAFFGMPAFFMDNSQDQVSDMFKAMIEWFDINNDGGSK